MNNEIKNISILVEEYIKMYNIRDSIIEKQQQEIESLASRLKATEKALEDERQANKERSNYPEYSFTIEIYLKSLNCSYKFDDLKEKREIWNKNMKDTIIYILQKQIEKKTLSNEDVEILKQEIVPEKYTLSTSEGILADFQTILSDLMFSNKYTYGSFSNEQNKLCLILKKKR